MTEAGWTREKPIAAGWYWWRLDDGQMQVVYVSAGGTVSISGVGKRSLKRLDGEWLGPLSPTDRQQGRVEGLREYREVVARELQLDHNNHPTRFKASIIEALDKADFEVAKIAQAAQGEKGVGE